MADEQPTFPVRLVAGALSGIVATAPMTAVMRRLHRRLKRKERYPLPPREIVSTVVPAFDRQAATSTTLLAHFAYGALSGAVLTAMVPRPTIKSGIMGGVGIWFTSYLGWIPAVGILKPATRHPGKRNRLMILAHVMWGATFALTQRSLLKSGRIFGGGPFKDAA